MAQSLIRLQVESNQYEQKMRKAKRQFEDFTASIGINMKKMTAYGLAAGAAASAINGLTSAMSEAVTEGIRMSKELEGVKAAFNRLNQPNLLKNLREATHGTVNDLDLMKQAVKFDNFNLSLDQMGTFLAFAQQQAKATGQDVGFLVESIVNGLGRKSLPILDNLGLSATEIRERMKETGDMTKAVADIIQDRMNAAGEYVETAADRSAKATADMQNAMMKLGETFGPITQNSDSLWNSIKIGAINALNYVGNLINYLHEAGRISKTIGNMNGGGMMERFGNNLRNSKDPSSLYQRQLAEINRSINSAEAKLQQAEKGGMGSIQIYRERVQALKEVKKQYQELYQTITRPPKPVSTGVESTTVTKGGRSSSNLPSMGDFDKALGKSLLDTDKLKEGKEMLSPYQLMLPEIEKNILKIKDADIGGELAKLGDKKVADEIAAITTRMEQQQKATELAAQAAQNFGAALAGLDDPAMKAAGTVMQAIANIALSFSMAAVQASSLGSYGWIAYMAAGAGALATTISTIHSLTGYAEGGMVKGNSYSGDNIFAGNAMVNAGELVLNKAQQATLAQNLQGEGRSINVQGILSGENILIATERTLKRKGRGELVTWK